MDIGLAPASAPTDRGDARTTGGLIDKLSRYLTLTAEECASLAALQAGRQHVKRRCDLVREGHPYDAVYVLCEGFVSRYRVLPDGRRQVLGFGMPGDLVGYPSCLFPRATASVCCVTDVRIAPVPLDELFALVVRFPRIGAALFWSAARDAAISNERLVTVGRRNADERVAYMFLELIALQGIAALRDGDRFTLPVTQELIADAVGFSTPHVNRVLRRLRERGLLSVDGQQVEVQNARDLILTASFDPAHFQPRPIPGR